MRVFTSALFAAMMLAMPVTLKAAEAPARLVTVVGEGSIGTAPDMAILTAGVMTQEETAKAALDKNSVATAAVIAVLKAEGIEDKDLSTTGFSLQPQIVYPNSSKAAPEDPQIIGYQVSNTVTVRVRDLAKLGDLLDKAVAGGANTINGVDFVVSKTSELLDEARKAALADARRKAELYAAAGGAKLGSIVSISEQSGGYPGPQPMMRAAFDGSAAKSAVPMQAGEQRLQVSVTATWLLQD